MHFPGRKFNLSVSRARKRGVVLKSLEIERGRERKFERRKNVGDKITVLIVLKHASRTEGRKLSCENICTSGVYFFSKILKKITAMREAFNIRSYFRTEVDVSITSTPTPVTDDSRRYIQR